MNDEDWNAHQKLVESFGKTKTVKPKYKAESTRKAVEQFEQCETAELVVGAAVLLSAVTLLALLLLGGL